jgi:hypothetical protein
MPSRIVAKKIRYGGRPASAIKISVSMYSMKGYAQGLNEAARKAAREAARRKAQKFFELTQRNIVAMKIGDRGMLLRSGYCRRIPEGGGEGWVVGYTAPHAWYVDLGTGPKAGHGPYSSPPPFEVIRGWVKRNFTELANLRYSATLKTTMVHEPGRKDRAIRQSLLIKPKITRVTRADGRVVYVVKPRKETKKEWAKPKPGETGMYLRPITGDKEIDKMTGKIVYSIFKHGTTPKPFWRNAQAQMKSVNRSEDLRAVSRMFLKGARYAFFNALRRGLRFIGGSAR